MNEFFYDPWLILLAFVFPGILIGAVYDFFRIMRIARAGEIDLHGGIYYKIRPKNIFRAKKSAVALKIADGIIIFAEDILFWILSAIIEIIFIYQLNNGEIRLGFLFFTAIGFILYRISVGRAVVFLSKQIIYFSRCLIFWTFYIIIYPIKVLFGFIVKTFSLIYRKINDYLQKCRSERASVRLLSEAECGFGTLKIITGGKYENKI